MPIRALTALRAFACIDVERGSGIVPTNSPSRRTSPESAGVSQLAVRSSVLLPHPLGPMMQTTSPLDTLSETSCNAVMPENDFRILVISRKLFFVSVPTAILSPILHGRVCMHDPGHTPAIRPV